MFRSGYKPSDEKIMGYRLQHIYYIAPYGGECCWILQISSYVYVACSYIGLKLFRL